MNAWALWKRWFGEARLLWAACALGLFAFCWIRVWIVSQLTTGSLEVILEQVWDKYEKYSPVSLSQLLTYHGRVALSFEEPIVIFGIAGWAIARGSDTIAGHVNRGVMELLLAQPVSRRSIYVSQSCVTLLGLVLLTLCIWLGMAAGIGTTQVREERLPSLTVPGLRFDIPIPFGKKQIERVPMWQRTSAGYYVYPALNLFCLGVFLSGLSTLLSACDRLRWRTIGIVSGFLAVEMVLRILCMSTESLAWLKFATFFSAYEPEVLVSVAVNAPQELWQVLHFDESGQLLRPGPLGYYLLLLVPGCLFYVAGLQVFLRRDLPAPL